MKDATLCYLIKEEAGRKEILLAKKKKGFGEGRWNGVGGKFEQERDKNIFETAVRETGEEIGVKIEAPEKVACLNFYFPYKKEWNQNVHVFLVKQWQGEPRETEEMSPKWFKDRELPYEEMWDDDKFWLESVLDGKKVKASFVFGEGEKLVEKNIEIAKEL